METASTFELRSVYLACFLAGSLNLVMSAVDLTGLMEIRCIVVLSEIRSFSRFHGEIINFRSEIRSFSRFHGEKKCLLG